jgi:uncharacterized protein YjdB
LALVACSSPIDAGAGGSGGSDGGTDTPLTIPVTAVSLVETYLNAEVGNDITLAFSVTPANSNTGTTWTSSADAVASVSSSGVVHCAGVGSATITLSSTADPSIKASVVFNVVAAGSLVSITSQFGFLNQTGVNADSTQALPPLVGNILSLNNTNGDSLVKLSVEKNTVVYFKTPLTGDFKFRARVLMTSRLLSTADRGVTVAAYAMPTAGTLDTAAPMAGLMYRARGDVRSYYHTGGAYSAGSPNIVNDTSNTFDVERTLEVIRDNTAGSYTFNIYVPKTGVLVGTGTVLNAGLNSAVTGTSPVYLALTVGGVSANFANIEVYDSLAAGATAVYKSGTVAASPVALKGITVTGPSNNPDATYQYQNSLAAVPAGGLQLSAVASPSFADNTAVSWTTSDSAVATVNSSGLVTVKAAGIATITATSAESGFTATYKINIVTGAQPVSAITVSAPASLMAGLLATPSVVVAPSYASNKVLTWTSSNTSVLTVDASSGRITAVGAGTATITASATDGSAVSGTSASISVSAFSAAIWNWSAASDTAFTLAAPVTLRGVTLTGNVATGALSFANPGGVAMVNKRFVLGSGYSDAISGGGQLGPTTTSYNPPDGQFNFTKKAKLTITYSSGTGSNFTVYLNNNTTSDSTTSPATSMLQQAADATATPPLLAISSKLYESGGSAASITTPTQAPVLAGASGGSLIYTIDPAVFTKNPQTLEKAFLQFRISSTAGTSITITGITIEYLP